MKPGIQASTYQSGSYNMHTTAQSAITLAFTLATAATQAQGLSLNTREGFQLGAEVSSYGYQEVVNDVPFIDVKGNKLGLTANYTGTFEDNAFVTLDLRYASGQVQYEGSGTATGADHLTDIRMTGGVDLARQGYTLSPYTGMGHRALHNDIAGYTTTGASGYRRDSTYLYLPLGLSHRFAALDGRIVTTLEYDYLIQGTQVSHLGDAGGPGDISNLQRNGYGLRINLSYETRHWSTGAFYQQWNIARSEDSTAVGNGWAVIGNEPQNTTREFGLAVKYLFY
jgi:hypothetical protein